MNREEWLDLLVAKLRPLIDETGDFTVAEHVRISTGFPSAGGLNRKKRVLGECWDAKVSADGSNQILVNPVLEDPLTVAAVTLHEMNHTATPGAKHKGAFVRLAKRLGFVKPWTGSVPGQELMERLTAIVTGMPPYPHVALVPTPEEKKQGTRMLKLVCPECGYTARTTKKWIDATLPVCVNGHDEREFNLEVEE